MCPQIRKKQNTRLLHFLSGPSLWQCRCLSGVLRSDVILEVPELGLESLPPTETLLWPSPTPGPVDPAPSRLADCSTASECSLAFIRRAATLAVRLLWHPYGGRKERPIGSGTQQEHNGLPNESRIVCHNGQLMSYSLYINFFDNTAYKLQFWSIYLLVTLYNKVLFVIIR